MPGLCRSFRYLIETFNPMTTTPSLRFFMWPAIITAGVLAIPFVGMQFSEEVHWTGMDFAIAAIMLLFFSSVIQYVLRNAQRKWLWAAVLLAAFLLIWAELSVGLFGSPFAGS